MIQEKDKVEVKKDPVSKNTVLKKMAYRLLVGYSKPVTRVTSPRA